MERCPVCDRELQSAVCPDCGFDRSMDYESWPTLCRVPDGASAVSARRETLAGAFRCPECGKNLFRFYPEEGALKCVSCRYVYQIELKKQEKTDPAEIVQTDENCQAFGNTISAGGLHTVGLRRDGTVVAVGADIYGQCRTYSWRDIVSISAGSHHTVGLRRDGTLIATAWILDDQYNVSDLRAAIPGTPIPW